MRSIDELLNYLGTFQITLHEQNVKLIVCLSKRNTNFVLECQSDGASMFFNVLQHDIYLVQTQKQRLFEKSNCRKPLQL